MSTRRSAADETGHTGMWGAKGTAAPIPLPPRGKTSPAPKGGKATPPPAGGETRAARSRRFAAPPERGLKCPGCGSPEHAVKDSRPEGEAVLRRRQCLACGARFTTFESARVGRSLRRDLVMIAGQIAALAAQLGRLETRLAEELGPRRDGDSDPKRGAR